MMKILKKYLMLLFLLLLPMPCLKIQAQSIRTESMAGMTYAVSDSENTLGLFHFAGNPAFAARDEKYASFRFLPEMGSTYGNFRRPMEAERKNLYSVYARDIMHLSKSSVFMSYGSYSLEKRFNVNRGLRLDNYEGDAFSLLDSANGNFTYNTTSFGLLYSFMPFEKLYLGAGAEYGITQGIKDRYSHSEDLQRSISVLAGAGYKFSDDFLAGAHLRFFDKQETIELKSIESPTSEIMNYIGDKYFTVINRETIQEKFRQQGIEGSVHFTYSPLKDMQVSVSSEFRQYNSVLLIPFDQEKESERGYAYFEKFNLRSRLFYQMTENFSLGARMEYRSSYSWSKNSHRSLTLWDWTVKGMHLGAGFSYYFRPSKLLIGAELELMPVNADSVKYIDSRTFSDGALNGSLRVGAEYEAFNDIYLRGGIIAGGDRWDFNRGMQEMKTEGFSFGIAGRFPGFADIDITAVYVRRAPLETIAGAEDIFKIYRKDFRIAASVKLYRF